MDNKRHGFFQPGRIADWLFRWLDSSDKTQDIRLLGFVVVVAYAITWLSLERGTRGITHEWNVAFMWLCGLVSIGTGAALWESLKNGPSDKPPES